MGDRNRRDLRNGKMWQGDTAALGVCAAAAWEAQRRHWSFLCNHQATLDMGDLVVRACCRAQGEGGDEVFFKQLKEASGPQDLLLMQDFSVHGICWKGNTAGPSSEQGSWRLPGGTCRYKSYVSQWR